MQEVIIHNGLEQQTMSLKEITDLLEMRHNNAMVIVSKMAESPEFGELQKFSSSYINNLGATLPLETYQLDKRQSIAVAARLNVAMLMRVIDRWQELEKSVVLLQNELLLARDNEIKSLTFDVQELLFENKTITKALEVTSQTLKNNVELNQELFDIMEAVKSDLYTRLRLIVREAYYYKSTDKIRVALDDDIIPKTYIAKILGWTDDVIDAVELSLIKDDKLRIITFEHMMSDYKIPSIGYMPIVHFGEEKLPAVVPRYAST